MFHLIQTREGFEGHLRTMQGLEFMVAYGPAQNAQQANGVSGGEDTGVWVIRKQNRRKTQGAEDEITILSTYFVVGENVYMAPSVGNVLGSRTVCLGHHSTLLHELKSAAIDGDVSYEIPQHGFVPTEFLAFSGLHIHAASTYLADLRSEYPAHATEQRGLTDARHAKPSQKYQNPTQLKAPFGRRLPGSSTDGRIFRALPPLRQRIHGREPSRRGAGLLHPLQGA